MPVGIETKCVVRIADTEEIVKELFKVDENTIIKDIPISRVMEVELIDFSSEKNFQIRSFNHDEQILQEGAFTQWLYFVKPLKQGIHTLYLKVSIVEYIEKEAKKKDIVLEQEINVITDIVEIIDQSEEWKETSVHVINDKKSNIASSFWAKKIKIFGISFSVLLLILVSGVNLVAGYVAYLIISPPKEEPKEEENDLDTVTVFIPEPIPKPLPDSPVQTIVVPPVKTPKPKKPDTIINLEPPPTQQQKIDTLIAKAKKQGYKLVDKLIPQDTVKAAGKIFIEIRTSGFKKGEIEFYIGSTKKFKITPSGRDGKIYFFNIGYADKVHTFTILDTDSNNSISRKIKGNTNYLWKVDRKAGGLIGF